MKNTIFILSAIVGTIGSYYLVKTIKDVLEFKNLDLSNICYCQLNDDKE